MWFGNKILYKKNNCNTKKKRYLFFTQKGYDNFIKANQNNTKDYSLNKSNIKSPGISIRLFTNESRSSGFVLPK